MLVTGRVNLGRFGIPANVATHAEVIAGERILVRMRVMAIKAGHAVLVHLAAQKGIEFVIFILDLAIGIPALGEIQCFQGVVVVKRVARHEILGQIGCPRVARTAHANHAGGA